MTPAQDPFYIVKEEIQESNLRRFLDKAAIIKHRSNQAGGSEAEKHMNPWRLATVTQVEELKLIMNMFPIWLATIPFGISVSQISTFFLKQCAVMDRRLTGSFEVPPASVYALGAIGMIICVSLYDRILVPLFRRLTGNERGISILQRIGVGIVFSGIAMVTAAIVEAKRLRIYDQVPDSMRSLGIGFF